MTMTTIERGMDERTLSLAGMTTLSGDELYEIDGGGPIAVLHTIGKVLVAVGTVLEKL